MFFSVDRCWAFFAPASANANKRARIAMTSATARLFSFASTAESLASDIEHPPSTQERPSVIRIGPRGSLPLFCDEVHDRSGGLQRLRGAAIWLIGLSGA